MNLHLIILMAQLIQDVMVNEDSCYSASTEISLQWRKNTHKDLSLY